MKIITLGGFLASAQSLPLRKLTHNDSMYIQRKYFFISGNRQKKTDALIVRVNTFLTLQT
jgi:hypothetical protein